MISKRTTESKGEHSMQVAHLAHAQKSLRGSVRAMRGFTLTEMLVAVGALALLSVGIAQVFSLTGRTVAAGRKLSNLNAAASAFERQMRADLSSLSTSGFIVIRNELASRNTGAVIPMALSPDDPLPRQRRVDELMFFANGDFSAQREPLGARPSVKAKEAMVYYGHGLGQFKDSVYYTGTPAVSDFNRHAGMNRATGPARTARFGDPAPGNPNRYASDWVLARRVVLLAPPSAVAREGVSLPGLNIPTNTLASNDSPFQIDLMPAAGTVFKTLNQRMFDTGRFEDGLAYRNASWRALAGPPRVSSGAVEIAATDIGQIRSWLFAGVDPNNGAWRGTRRDTISNDVFNFTNNASSRESYHRFMQWWMIDALPAGSMIQDVNSIVSVSGSVNGGERIRVETSPPNLLGIGRAGTFVDADRGFQDMLATSAFLPRCTEFIVEWSYGVIQPDVGTRVRIANPYSPGNDITGTFPTMINPGKVMWHGLARDADGALETAVNGQPSQDVWPFARVTSLMDGANLPLPLRRLVQRDGKEGFATFASGTNREPDGVRPNLVELASSIPSAFLGSVPGGSPGNNQTEYVAAFGPIDPFYTPNLTNLLRDVNQDGIYQPELGDALAEPDTLKPAWPTMIRVTYSLADPTDPTIEQTFQMVFELPTQRNALIWK